MIMSTNRLENDSQYLLRQIAILQHAQEYDLALAICFKLLELSEVTSQAHLEAAKCYELKQVFEKSIQHYQESIAFGANVEAFKGLSRVYMRLGHDEKAAHILERVVSHVTLDVDLELLYQSIGNCYFRAQLWKDAQESYQKALDINPKSSHLLTHLGFVSLQLRDIESAKNYFQNAVAVNPQNSKAFSGLGCCAVAKDQYQSAHDFFARSLEIDPYNSTSIFYLVKSAYSIKSFAIAERLVKNYINNKPMNADLLYSLAGLQYHLGKLQQASASLKQVFELDAEHVAAKELQIKVNRLLYPNVSLRPVHSTA
jgi:tetratricopeptide (TPR) repeat protein